MSKISDLGDEILKKLKGFPGDIIPETFLEENEFEVIESQKKFSLPNLPFDNTPSNYMNRHEINIENENNIDLSKLNFGEINEQFMRKKSIESDNVKGTDLFPSPVGKSVEKSDANSITLKKQEEFDYKNIEHFISSKIIEQHNLLCLKGSLYLYNSSKGHFFELEEFQIRTLVRTGWSTKVAGLLSKSRVDDIVDRLRTSAEIQIEEDYLDSYSNLINFNDCVLDTNTDSVLKHSPKYYFTNFINANFCNKESKGQNFMRFINQCTQGDEKKSEQLQELFGYVISNYSNAKRWFVLIGQPHSGKSTILELLTDIIGDDYTSNVPLHELGGKFALADLFMKKMNVCGELKDGVLNNISTIKAVTGNDRLRADRKYKVPIHFVNRAKIIMAGNSMFQLKTLDNTSAFIDRILFIVFNSSIPENKRDYKLKEKLLLEKDFIVRWAVEGLKRLKRNNFSFTECRDSIDFKKQYQDEMSNLTDFIDSECILSPNNERYRVHKRDLYDAYINYSRENCQNILGKKEFFNEIKKLQVKQSKFRFKKSNPLDGYVGITLRIYVDHENNL